MTDSQSSKSRPKVVVLGAGFAGLNAAKTLGSAHVDVTIIDRNNHHTFHPLLYQVALAVLSPGILHSQSVPSSAITIMSKCSWRKLVRLMLSLKLWP